MAIATQAPVTRPRPARPRNRPRRRPRNRLLLAVLAGPKIAFLVSSPTVRVAILFLVLFVSTLVQLRFVEQKAHYA
jgi:hypothetical protein